MYDDARSNRERSLREYRQATKPDPERARLWREYQQATTNPKRERWLRKRHQGTKPNRARSLRVYRQAEARILDVWDAIANLIDAVCDDQAKTWLAYLVADLTLLSYDEDGYDGRYQSSNYLYTPAPKWET